MTENNFIYCTNYNHYGSYSCEDSGCNDEGICRCYSIESIEIIDIYMNDLTNNIFGDLHFHDSQYLRDKKITQIIFDFDSDIINRYCINRILTVNKVWDKENWYGEKTGGYYGDEVSEIKIDDKIYEIITQQINQILQYDTIEDKINFVLKLEYGRILDELKGKKYSEVIVNIDDLDFRQDNHHKNVLKKTLTYYSDENYSKELPRGVAIWNGKKWRVIDGYHRLSQTKLKKIKIIGIK